MNLIETDLPPFLLPLMVGFFIQAIKLLIDYYKEKNFKLEYIRRAGGIPSVHSAITSSIVTLVLLIQGVHSLEFAITISFAFLFWYDAMHVRNEAGKHAYHINKISLELQETLNISSHDQTLKERLGHNSLEVILGILSGTIMTIILYHFTFSPLI